MYPLICFCLFLYLVGFFWFMELISYNVWVTDKKSYSNRVFYTNSMPISRNCSTLKKSRIPYTFWEKSNKSQKNPKKSQILYNIRRSNLLLVSNCPSRYVNENYFSFPLQPYILSAHRTLVSKAEVQEMATEGRQMKCDVIQMFLFNDSIEV